MGARATAQVVRFAKNPSEQDEEEVRTFLLEIREETFQPSFSPDGSRVVFTSDRTGWAQVYEAEIPGGWLD